MSGVNENPAEDRERDDVQPESITLEVHDGMIGHANYTINEG